MPIKLKNKKQTMEQRVAEFMNTSPVHRAFVMQAVEKYANDVCKHRDEIIDNQNFSFVTGEFWVGCADKWMNDVSVE